MALGGKRQIIRNVYQTCIGVAQKRLRLFDFLFPHIVTHGYAEILLEHAGKVADRQPRIAGECLYEAAQLDGCTSGQMFWKITMPLIRPLLIYTLITSVVGGLQMFDVPQILSNGQGSPNKSTTTIIMYLNQHLFSKNYGTAGALSVLLFLVCGVLCVMIYKLQSKED